MKKLIIVAATAALMTACASGPTHTLDQANAALVAASQATAKVKKVNYEWRDTGKLIKKARKAKTAGDFDTAVKLANKAKRQSELAYVQYLDQKDAKPHY